eukprot:TRINITY_DN1454_c0_g1_i1.p1 TRINITY_DN1454_c0_g1~~TRINITY_DN1454_c0_g1_i1.p1  ORF type:complete len:431 (-),score=63.96 TRINITY_DN1454_c0_g1_i1:600-1892(-)
MSAIDHHGLMRLPWPVLQSIVDWLPLHKDRIKFRQSCRRAQERDWRSGPPRLSHSSSMFNFVPLGNLGACAIAQALADMSDEGPTHLNLCNAGIRDAGAKAIAVVLVSSSVRLKCLYLSGNNIGDEGARALFVALCSHPSLEEIDLCGNLLSASCVGEIRSPQPGGTTKKTMVVDARLPLPTYLEQTQTAMNEGARRILADWIFEVCWKASDLDPLRRIRGACACGLHAMSLVDRYLSDQHEPEDRWQLVGVAALFIAARHGRSETWKRDDEAFSFLAYLTTNAYTAEQVYAKVLQMRKNLDGATFQYTAHELSKRYLTYMGWNSDTFRLVEYLLVLATLDVTFLKYPPQILGAASVVLAHNTLGGRSGAIECWEERLLWKCSRILYPQDFSDECLDLLTRLLSNHNELQNTCPSLRLFIDDNGQTLFTN